MAWRATISRGDGGGHPLSILDPTPENLAFCGRSLREGRLVGMPTETVYGIAGDALNEVAVRAIFLAKGRPAENPLIVHVASIEEVARVADEVPPEALQLAERFWPGPLTMVLRKRPVVPSITTGGLDTVAVRQPGHPVARALIQAAGRPLAAPSANPFMSLSPTRAQDVDPALGARLAAILDGGPCAVGLESTVVDLTEKPIRLLRLGAITQDQLEEALGQPILRGREGVIRAPGQYARHYAPRTPIRLATALGSAEAGLTFTKPLNGAQIQMPDNPAAYGQALYAALHELDRRDLSEIVVEQPPRTTSWDAIWDRLSRAAHPAD